MNSGSVIVLCKDGWACTNEATILVEQQIVRNPDGSMYSQHKHVIRAMFIHFEKGTLNMGDTVEAIFKHDENGIKKTYEAMVTGLTHEMAILGIIKETNNEKNIIKQIKGGN